MQVRVTLVDETTCFGFQFPTPNFRDSITDDCLHGIQRLTLLVIKQGGNNDGDLIIQAPARFDFELCSGSGPFRLRFDFFFTMLQIIKCARQFGE